MVKFGWSVRGNWKPFVTIMLEKESEIGYPFVGLHDEVPLRETIPDMRRLDNYVLRIVKTW